MMRGRIIQDIGLRFLLALALFSVNGFSGASASAAAEFEVVESELCHVRLSGEIKIGDTERLETFLAEYSGQKTLYSFSGRLCLDSPGGSYAEALKMIEFIWSIGVGSTVHTILEPNATCLSACALIFMAGNHNEIGNPSPARTMHVTSTLGFHAPSAEFPEGIPFDSEFVAFSVQEAAASIGELMILDRHQLIPRSLLSRALAVSGSEFLVVDTVGRAAVWEIAVYGDARPEQILLSDILQVCGNLELLYWESFIRATELAVDFDADDNPIIQRNKYGDFEINDAILINSEHLDYIFENQGLIINRLLKKSGLDATART